MKKEENVSWYEITSFCHTLKLEVKPDLIIGIHRGGLPLAVMLSHRFKCQMDVVYTTRDKEEVQYFNKYAASYNNILIVDDVSDSGNSLTRVVNHITQTVPVSIIQTLTYARKPHTCYEPTYCCKTFEKDVWVIFPWEII